MTADNQAETAPAGLLLCRDLFFTSKVTGTAAAMGMKVATVGDIEQLSLKLAAGDCRFVIVDLETPGLDPARVMAVLPAEKRPVVIAFGAHVHEHLLGAATEAGCDQVLPRSRFSATLPQILKGVVNVAGEF